MLTDWFAQKNVDDTVIFVTIFIPGSLVRIRFVRFLTILFPSNLKVYSTSAPSWPARNNRIILSGTNTNLAQDKSIGKLNLCYACSVFVTSVVQWYSKSEYTLYLFSVFLFIELLAMTNMYFLYNKTIHTHNCMFYLAYIIRLIIIIIRLSFEWMISDLV